MTIVLVAREMVGWAEAGGVKDVVFGQAQAFRSLGWGVHVVLPFYGFLQEKLGGEATWTGSTHHPYFPVEIKAFSREDSGIVLHFIRSPYLSEKYSPYTYTQQDELADPSHGRGQGFVDAWEANLEFQWSAAAFLSASEIRPQFILAHDGHSGFLPAICRTSFPQASFKQTEFVVLIHNAGKGYRQEMPGTEAIEHLVGLHHDEFCNSLAEGQAEPLISASIHARLLTVSENYAHELLTGKNDLWSGAFGRWLRKSLVPLKGITNGLDLSDKDPRYPERSGLPASFDPQDWGGKKICRKALCDYLSLHSANTYGRLTKGDAPLYVMQGRLAAQKGVEALIGLITKALSLTAEPVFLIMGQGERCYEERLIQLAREAAEMGRFLFINRFEAPLERLVLASGDVFLMPSEYEPCGLTDLKAQIVGTLPLVHRVGGLVKVIPNKTGFGYEEGTNEGLWTAFLHSLSVFLQQPDAWKKIQQEAFYTVLEDYSWRHVVEEFYIPWLTQRGDLSILSGIPPT